MDDAAKRVKRQGSYLLIGMLPIPTTSSASRSEQCRIVLNASLQPDKWQFLILACYADTTTLKYWYRHITPPLCAHLVQDALKVDALGSLNRQSQRPVPDELRKRPKSTADTERRRVVERLLESVMVEENSR